MRSLKALAALVVLTALAVLAAALAVVPAASAQTAQFCAPGQVPGFQFGFLALKEQLGETMGEPIECEHTNPENGDSLQHTTTGLSFYRKATNTPTFTNGFEHWGLTADGLVYWTGDSIDPPGVFAPAPAPVQPAPPPTAPAPPPPPPPAPRPAPAPPPPAPPPPATAPAPAPAPPARACCRYCTRGKACGDTCINVNLTCRVGQGCACNAREPLRIDELFMLGIGLLFDTGEARAVAAADACPDILAAGWEAPGDDG